MTADFDWDGLAAMWIEHADRTVARMGARHPDETFYVLVFMLDEELYGPNLAMQSLEAMSIDASERAGDFYDAKWSPFEWGERELVEAPDGFDENVRRYRALGEHARSGDRAHFDAVHARHHAVVVEATRVVAARARAREGAFATLRMPDDFVVFAREHDVRRPFELARETIPADVVARFFAKDLAEERERSVIAAMPVSERVAYLVSRLGKFGAPVSSEEARAQLATIGAPAVAPIAALLGDPKLGWEAAAVLAAMGPVAASTAEALITVVRTDPRSAVWAAKALGAMGRFDALMSIAESAELQPTAIAGLVVGRPRTYPLLTTLFETSPTARAAVTLALSPGRASYAPKAEELALVARYAASPHAVLRADVAIALGRAEGSSEDQAAAVSLLVTMLRDDASEVRRLAASALFEHGHGARTALDALRTCEKDAVQNVAQFASRAIDEIERDVARRRVG